MPSQLPTLPPASDIALAHSHILQEVIQAEIQAAGGWIPFAQYMDLALYAPGLGYYSGGSAKFGGAGDFVTAPEISSLFGRTLARQIIQVFELTKAANILEFGAGSGKLALDLLLELERSDHLPEKYFILEVSAELQHRQQCLFNERAPHLAPLLEWLEQLPSQFNGVILANEVLDAMPVHIVTWRGIDFFERGVICQNNTFAWQDHPIQNKALLKAASQLADRINPDHDTALCYISEINLNADRFMRSLSDILQSGVAILIDYGFGHNEYYHPQRDQGTLMCHYRHYAHEDPFYLPGLQDITSHVNFSALTEAIEETDLMLFGYTTQSHFLINCGITDILTQTPVENTGHYLPQANQLQRLVSPAEMGELFKVAAFGKIDPIQSLIGFEHHDRSHSL